MSIHAPKHLENTSSEQWWIDLEVIRREVEAEADRYGVAFLMDVALHLDEAKGILEKGGEW